MSTFEVRCCCNPKKLLGTLMLSDNVRVAHGLTHRLAVPGGNEVTIRFQKYTDGRLIGSARSRLAIPSDERPIEFWRNVPGFVETI